LGNLLPLRIILENFLPVKQLAPKVGHQVHRLRVEPVGFFENLRARLSVFLVPPVSFPRRVCDSTGFFYFITREL
jgi:hypothetical protein